jgi:queuine tRNA-ribosyltransferase
MGWDLFDCVLPTRNARHGYLYVPLGEGDTHYENYSVLHIKNSQYKFADEPISTNTHPALKNVSRAYLRHLIRNKETAGQRLATLNNLWFYSETMKSIRN